jgi:uncharacterized metal-binding protein
LSSGKIHKRANIAFGVGVVGTSILFGMPSVVIAGTIAGSVAGTTVTCDYDLNAALPASFMTRIPGVRVLWGTFWRPYQLMFKHRSFWSHTPFVGTTGRVLYIALWIWFWSWIFWQLGFDISPEGVLNWFKLNVDFWIVTFLVWCCQDIVHWILDL